MTRMPANNASGGFDFNHRSSGVLLHVTSLPGSLGCGDLGPEALRFLDFLANAGQSWWQVLPTGPAGRAPAFSPYDSPSAFAGSPWMVSLERLVGDGLLSKRDLSPVPGLTAGRVNFPVVLKFREERLRAAFVNFRRKRGERGRAFRNFCEANADWLEDFALFMALRREFGGRAWMDWESELREREPSALRAARERLADEIAGQRFVQFQFDRQWQALRAEAHRRRIGLIGDLPIFVAHDSADVWSHPGLFQLDGQGRALRVSGYPPDRFNHNGQCWGHPQYHWAAHERTGFAWWVRRFERMFELFDAVRIDHFLGFTRTWSIPGDAPNARKGRWAKSPGTKLFAAVRRRLGPRPMIAEDLGHVTPADIRLRDKFGLAPMRLFQFGFGKDAGSAEHQPHNYPRLCAGYTGNHDNNTTLGWFREQKPAAQRRVLRYLAGRLHLNEARSGVRPAAARQSAISQDAMRTLMASPANVVLFPMQDVLGLDERARMNVPGTIEGNWSWRMSSPRLSRATRDLRALAETFGRTGPAARNFTGSRRGTTAIDDRRSARSGEGASPAGGMNQRRRQGRRPRRITS